MPRSKGVLHRRCVWRVHPWAEDSGANSRHRWETVQSGGCPAGRAVSLHREDGLGLPRCLRGSCIIPPGLWFPGFHAFRSLAGDSQMGAGSSGLGGEPVCRPWGDPVRRPRGGPHRRSRDGSHPGHTATSRFFQASLRAVQTACSNSSSGQRSEFSRLWFFCSHLVVWL